MHNRVVSYFEECLSLGDRLFQDERRALYKYLLESNKDFYKIQANSLLDTGKITRRIAKGEATYFLKDRNVNYSAKKLNSDEVYSGLRNIKLTRFRLYNISRLQRFFAQCDVDVISNFPLLGHTPQEEGGYGFNAHPYYTLAYYANGQNPLVGLIKKIKTDDKELLTKLRTL